MDAKPAKPKSEAMHWVTLCELYKAKIRIAKTSEAHQGNVARALDRFTTVMKLHDRRIDEIHQTDIQGYVEQRQQDTWAGPRGKERERFITSRTVNNDINIINAVLKYAGPRINVNGHRENLHLLPMPPYYQPLAEESHNPVAATVEQLDAFVKATAFATSPRSSVCDPQRFWLAVLVLDSITAVRRGGLLQIRRPSDHDLFVKREIELPAAHAKNKHAQILSLGTRDEVVELLASLNSKPGEYLLPWRRTDGRPLSTNHFNRVMKSFQKEAGIPDGMALRTKHLRSTAATEIIGAQWSTDVARKKLGHKSENVIIENYLKRMITPADLAATDFLADRVLSVIPKSNGLN